MTAAARTVAAGMNVPHLAIAKPVMRYDIGDHLARRFGVPMVRVYCRYALGDPAGTDMVSTLTTRNPGKVRCPACREYADKIALNGTRVEVWDPDTDSGQPAVVEGWQYGEPRFKYLVRYSNGCVTTVDEYRVRVVG